MKSHTLKLRHIGVGIGSVVLVALHVGAFASCGGDDTQEGPVVIDGGHLDTSTGSGGGNGTGGATGTGGDGTGGATGTGGDATGGATGTGGDTGDGGPADAEAGAPACVWDGGGTCNPCPVTFDDYLNACSSYGGACEQAVMPIADGGLPAIP
jgi:hypothetical protein